MIRSVRALPIRWRMALWFAVLLVALVGGVGVFLLTTLDDVLQEQVDAALRLRASRVEREIAVGDDGRLDPSDVEAGLLELAPLEEFSTPGIYVQVRDSGGTVLAASANLPQGQLPVPAHLVDLALTGREVFETVPIGNEHIRVLGWPVDTPGPVVGIVVVGQSLRFVDVTRAGVQRLIILAAVVAVGAALAGGWWLTARSLNPVADVTRVAEEITATGRFERRIVQPSADDELGRLVATFNRMLGRLERTFRAQQEFLADASHELRGPLMVIRGNLDLLRLGLPEEERRACVREAGEAVERMSCLAADLLLLASVDEGLGEREPVRLDEVVADAWDRAQRLDAGAHSLSLGSVDALVVRGDRAQLEQLVWNLVENALRYTPSPGRVTVELRAQNGGAEFCVSDSGIGIAPEHLTRIFDRFYRPDRARSRRHGGAGLGLAIVKRIAQAHGGQPAVASTPGEGSTFSVWLPAQRAEPGRDDVSGDGQPVRMVASDR